MLTSEDKLTIRQICEATGLSVRTIGGWRDGGHIKSVGQTRNSGGQLVSLFLWGDVKPIVARHTTGVNSREMADQLCPPGYIRVATAASQLRVCQNTVRVGARDGRISSIRVPTPGIGGQYFVYVEKSAIDKMLSERTVSRRPGKSILPPTASSNPLIDADDSVCLQARRELWERNKRIFKRNENCVDSKKMVG